MKKENVYMLYYVLTSLVSLKQGNAKNSENMTKIFISSERLEEFQLNYQERCDLR